MLSKHRQKVVVDDEESKLVPVTSGVPHDSVLGLILFLIYINDLPQDIFSHVCLFADDTAIYLTIENKNDLRLYRGTWADCRLGKAKRIWSAKLSG